MNISMGINTMKGFEKNQQVATVIDLVYDMS
jgi:hypothetical protein